MSKYIQTNLANLRFAKGRLTQRDVSKATGIGQKTLSALETGASQGIEFNTLVKLCSFFMCSPGDILIIEEEPEDVPPSPEALTKADELIARGLKAAVSSSVQTPTELWAEFEIVRTRLQQARLNSAPKRRLASD